MILLAYGTRPEYIKFKPLIKVFDLNHFPYRTLFTGQHEDLIKEAKPDYKITIVDGENRLDSIVASIMNWMSKIQKVSDITHVMVQGDTTSAMAVALSAFHHGVKIIHLEAGLRTHDRENPYPEEVNRKIISEIADIHLCPTDWAQRNLVCEKAKGEIHVVGNTVIDNLLPYKDKCKYTNKILVTLHRRENHHLMKEWFTELEKLATEYPQYMFLLPIHPNPNVQKWKYLLNNVTVIDPLPYEKMLEILIQCRLVITDSGGLQEESCFFNKICLTCRTVTERPEAIGVNGLLVTRPEDLKHFFAEVHNDYKIDVDCPFGDGHAAEKIMAILKYVR